MRMKPAVLPAYLTLVFISGLAAGMKAQSRAPQDLQAVNTRAMEEPIAFSVLKQLTNEIGPRLTGSVQEQRAAQWAIAEMRRIHLSNIHAESWQLQKAWRRGYARGQILSPFPLELILTSLVGLAPHRRAGSKLML